MSKFNTIFKKTLKYIIGTALIGFAIYSVLAIIFFHEGDVSLNTISNSRIVYNKTGIPGAYIADFFLQFFGISSLLIILLILKLGFNFITNKLIRYNIYYKIISFILFILSINPITTYLSNRHSYLNIKDHAGFVGTYILQSIQNKEYFLIGFLIVALFSLTILLDRPFKIWLILYYKMLGIIKKILKYILHNLWKILGFLVPNKIKYFFSGFKNYKQLYNSQNEKIKQLEEYILKSRLEREYLDNDPEENLKTKNLNNSEVSVPKQISKSTESINRIKISNKNKYILPGTDLLKKPSLPEDNITKEELIGQANKLKSVLEDFHVTGKVISVKAGPIITLYEFEPAAGTKSARIIGLADDIARNLRVKSTRISVIENKNAMGIELPNKFRETIYLRSILESKEFRHNNYVLPIILGTNISGEPVVIDLAKTPHLLIAGTTGSGKSVSINTMILSLLYRFTPDECKFIMVDPKMLELSAYEGIPHLLTPVVTEPQKAITSLKWVVSEMEERYRMMAKLGVRHISGYNERLKKAEAEGKPLVAKILLGYDEYGNPLYENKTIDTKPIPYIVVVVDEMADLMITAGKDIEALIQRIAQMARAAGIHIIMATQRPSVDVITGVIKANFPSRISFLVSSKIDSKVIIGEQGAEQLLGYGDMLYMTNGAKLTRAHGPFVSDDEVEKVVSFINTQGFKPAYVREIIENTNDETNTNFEISMNSKDLDIEELYQQAVQIVKRDRKTSISYIQRVLRIGYNKAATLIERMEAEGILTQPNSLGKRDIIE